MQLNCAGISDDSSEEGSPPPVPPYVPDEVIRGGTGCTCMEDRSLVGGGCNLGPAWSRIAPSISLLCKKQEFPLCMKL